MHSQGWRHRILWLFLIASLAFNAGVGATVGVRAYSKYTAEAPQQEPDRPRRWPRMMKELNLTEEQRAGLRAERRELRRRHQHLRETVRVETDVLADLITVPQPDRQAIADQLNTLGEFRAQMDRDLVEHLLTIRSMLKPAQHEAFDRVIRHTLHHGGHGQRGPGGPRGRIPGQGQERNGPRHHGADDPWPLPEKETQ